VQALAGLRRGRGPGHAAYLIGVIAGCALQLHERALSSPAWYAGLLLFAACALAGTFGRGWARLPVAVLLAACLGWAATGLRATVFEAGALPSALEGRDIQVRGRVSAMPQRNEAGVRFRFDISAAVLDGRPVTVPPVVMLGWYNAQADVRAGDEWRMTVRLKAAHGNSNPHGFDYELWMWEQGLRASGTVRPGPAAPVLAAPTWKNPVERARQAVRDAIFARLAAPDEDGRRLAGIVAALVVGDQNAIDRADWDVFRATGVAHLMSISGLHITMFAWACALAAGWLWRRSQRLCLAVPAPHAALFAGVALAAGYALFSGWGVPSQRTVWMLAVVAVLRLAGRRWPWPDVWLAAMFAIVVADPWALMQAGFWLSFVAVGILFATDAGVPHEGRGVVARLGAALREQLVVTVALTPLVLLLFSQVSLVGLAANALAIPWVTLVVTPLSLLGVAAPPLWDAAAGALRLLDAYLRLLAALPFASISMPAPPLWAGIAGVAGGGIMVMRWPLPLRLLGLPLLLPALMWQPIRPPAGHFELVAADVGQGNAVIVRTASHAMVYDAGPRFSTESDAGSRVLVPLLRALGEEVDTMVLSHRDADHAGGAHAVLKMQARSALLSSIEEGHELQALRPATRCTAGQRWQWDGVDFEILHPQAADYGLDLKPNGLSCVLKISSRGGTALLAGDIEAAQEQAMVRRAAQLRSDVLLVPHHGSNTSSTAAFLDAVKPRIALVQAGYRNRFGHPAAPVMDRYEERGIAVFQSPRCGAMTWSSAQPGRVKCQRDEGRRYWHHHVP
jgi:competence protein ComEC